MIKPEVVERIRQETDIVELVGGYLPLKKVGKYYRGLCPFHPERTPSFYVSPERQSYHCFGCGAGGNAISFIMAYEKLEFPEAVKFLAQRLGIIVEEERISSRNQSLYDACERATHFFEEMLRKSESAQNYLQRRGLRPETVKRFRLGFAPAGNLLRGAARKLSIPDEVLVQAGLIIKKDDGVINYFRNRIIFPIFSISGKVIGFCGRVLDDSEPKYLNSPDTPIFHKGDILYGIFQAKAYIREQIPILVEGNFDLLSLVDRGINNVVAGLGTALTTAQALLLRRYNARVILCYDGDAAGQQACRRSLETLLRSGVDPQVMRLPAGVDPDSCIQKEGKEKFLARMQQLDDFVDFIMANKNLKKVTDQRMILAELKGLLRLIPDQISRELYGNRIAKLFGINSNRLLSGSSESADSHNVTRRVNSIEEKLVAVAVQDRRFAQVALEFCLSETLEDKTLMEIARLAEEHCNDPNFSPEMLIDLVENKDGQSLIARWTFDEAALPSVAEFRKRVRQFRARWLHQQIVLAHQAGDEEQAEILGRERQKLLKDNVQERSV